MDDTVYPHFWDLQPQSLGYKMVDLCPYFFNFWLTWCPNCWSTLGLHRWNEQKEEWTYYVETEVSGHSKLLVLKIQTAFNTLSVKN